MGKKHRRPVPDMRPLHAEVMERVDRYAEINLVTGCWDWEGDRNPLGYGNMYFKGRVWTVTRLVYSATHGAFDPDLDICHSCDNPMCVNVEHLRVDTHQNNLRDASKRKRLQGQWKTHCKRGHPLEGENLHVCSKGFRHCKTCVRIRHREAYRNNPELRARARVYRQKRYAEMKAQKVAS